MLDDGGAVEGALDSSSVHAATKAIDIAATTAASA